MTEVYNPVAFKRFYGIQKRGFFVKLHMTCLILPCETGHNDYVTGYRRVKCKDINKRENPNGRPPDIQKC